MDVQTSRQNRRGTTLTNAVTDQISQLLIDNAMRPGDALPSEESLATTFEASKRVVREALRTLTAQGIVMTSQGRRAVVANGIPLVFERYFEYIQRVDRGSVLELYELREIIEVSAAALAATRATPADLENAEKGLQIMEAAVDDVDGYVTGDLAFHNAIVNATHNRFVSAIMNALSGALRDEREMGVRNRQVGHGRPRGIAEHRIILNALTNRDIGGAELAMKVHMESGKIDLYSEAEREQRKGNGA